MVSKEIETLRAEVERWHGKAQDAGAAYGIANLRHRAELDRANRLERLADTLAGKAVDLEDRARKAEAEARRLQRERDDANSRALRHWERAKTAERALADERAKVARVEAAVSRAESIEPQGSPEWVESGRSMQSTVLREIRLAMDSE